MSQDKYRSVELERLEVALAELVSACTGAGLVVDRVELACGEQVAQAAVLAGKVARGRDLLDPAIRTDISGVDLMATKRPKTPGVRYGADGKRYAEPYGFAMMLVGDVVYIPAEEAQHSKIESFRVLCASWGGRLRRRFKCSEMADGSRQIERIE